MVSGREGLYENLRLVIIVTEFCGRASLLALEQAVEVAQIVVAAQIADVGHALVCIDKHTGRIAQTDINDIVTESTAGVELEKTAEGSFAHAGQAGQRLQFQLFHIMLVDIVLHLENPVGILLDDDLGITARRQGTSPVNLRQRVQYAEKSDESLETVGHAAQFSQVVVDLHDGIHGESQPLASLIEHPVDFLERILAQQAALTQAEMELYGHLMNVIALAFILQPYMFQFSACDQDEIVFPYDLTAVAHDAADARGMLHEVQLKHFMVVYRISKLLLVPVGDVKDVFVHQGSYLMEDMVDRGCRFHLVNLIEWLGQNWRSMISRHIRVLW